jgi:hypothetical protein
MERGQTIFDCRLPIADSRYRPEQRDLFLTISPEEGPGGSLRATVTGFDRQRDLFHEEQRPLFTEERPDPILLYLPVAEEPSPGSRTHRPLPRGEERGIAGEVLDSPLTRVAALAMAEEISALFLGAAIVAADFDLLDESSATVSCISMTFTRIDGPELSEHGYVVGASVDRYEARFWELHSAGVIAFQYPDADPESARGSWLVYRGRRLRIREKGGVR